MTRDNEKRSGAAAMPPVGALPSEGAGAPLMFSAPTEIVDLPSKGKFYPEDHPLRDVAEIEIRHMTAKEEDILTNVALIKKGVAIDRMLQNIIKTPNVEVEQMFSGDKNALTVAARITGFGANYEPKVRCPACQATTEFSFDLNEHKVIDGTELPDNVKNTANGTFMISDLPACEHVVEVRLMTGRDERALAKSQEQRKKNNLPPTLVTDQLKMVIDSVGGSTQPADINAFVDTMPLRTAKALRRIYSDITPNVDLTQNFVCSKCEHEEQMEVPFSTEFFWSNK